MRGDREQHERATAGKYRRLQRLSDANHRFALLAIDQRGSLLKMLAAHTQRPASNVSDEALALIKEVITAAVAPFATAVLTDPIYGYPAAPKAVPPAVGVLLALEVTGYEASNSAERLTRLIDGWSVRGIGQTGADAVKVLVWHHPDASQQTLQHQESLVERVGAQCAEEGLPFVLEIVGYPLEGHTAVSVEYARAKPDIVLDGAQRYSQPRFGVDLLKVEFPTNLKYVGEYQDRAFGGHEVIWDLSEVASICRQLDEASHVPWVILSAGVDPAEFVENVRLANDAGASGFICGRAVWKHVVDWFPDASAMRRFAEETARELFVRIRNANDEARPWTRHPHALRLQRQPAKKAF